jgi:signal transduction histidine kinase
LGFVILNIIHHYKLNSFIKDTIFEREVVAKYEKDNEFQKSMKNVYDEHIFSITHELRSPLAVIAASTKNQYNTLRKIYNSFTLTNQSLYKDSFKETKTQLEYISHQAEIVETFIASIAEHASYMSEEGDKKYVDLHKYLLSIIINSRSFSRNMKIFKNNIHFGDFLGTDFFGASVQVSPHDLSRMLTNIMTNSADAVYSSYSTKKTEDTDYEPELKIRCMKSSHPDKNIILTDDFMRINGNENEGHPFYIFIEDNGSGISKENVTKIFNYRHSTKTNDDNDLINSHHGLGLYLTIKLANKNGIKLYVKTDSTGTMFALGFSKVFFGDKKKKSDEESNKDYANNLYVSEDSVLLYGKYKLDERDSSATYPAIKQKTPRKKFLGVF